MFGSDSVHDVLWRHSDVDGYISRVNPDVYPDFNQSKFDSLLAEWSRRGVAGMPHPELMQVAIEMLCVELKFRSQRHALCPACLVRNPSPPVSTRTALASARFLVLLTPFPSAASLT